MTEVTSASRYIHELALAASIVITAFSQVMIRLGAMNKARAIASILNVKTALGYGMFVIVVLLMIFAMQEIPLRTAIAWNSLTYVLTPLAARWLLKDPLNPRMLVGSGVIMLGVVVFSL